MTDAKHDDRRARSRRPVWGAVLAFSMLASLGVALDIANSPTVVAAPGDANLVPIVPARLLETRSGPTFTTGDGKFEGEGRVGARATIELDVAGRGGVDDDAEAVMLNVTAVAPDALGYLTVFPCDVERPQASHVNYFAGDVAPNSVLAKLSADGKVCIFSLANTDVLVDVNGYVPVDGAPVSVVPARLVETRQTDVDVTVDGESEGIGRATAGQTISFRVTGRGNVPADAEAVYLNVTAIAPDDFGFLTVFPCGTDRPGTSNVNYGPGDVTPNAVLTTVGANGTVCVYTKAGADIIADVNGYLPPGGNRQSIQPARCADTRIPDGKTFDGLYEGDGRIAAGGTYKVLINGRCGIAANASAAYLNVTAVNADAAGFLTVWPCDEDRPGTSNVNYGPGEAQPNAVLSKVSVADDGFICIYSKATVDVIVDVNGYVPAPSPNFIDLAYGGSHGCAVDEDGEVTCWGRSDFFRIPGADENQIGTMPVTVPGIDDAVAIDAASSHTCVLLGDATVQCWGTNSYGVLGNGTDTSTDAITSVSGLTDVASLDVGEQQSCAVKTDGTVWCWGRNHLGQLGDGTINTSSVPVQMTELPDGSKAVQAAASISTTCVLLESGSIKCVGFPSSFGDGPGSGGDGMVRDVDGVVDDATALSASTNGFCAIRGTGTVWCWGNGFFGQIGNGETASQVDIATQTSTITNATSIAGLDSANCAVTADAEAYCWGSDSGQQLGNGSEIPAEGSVVLTPTRVLIDAEVAKTAGGDNGVTCWLLLDGNAMCAGSNFEFRLGAPTATGAGSPRPIYVQA